MSIISLVGGAIRQTSSAVQHLPEAPVMTRLNSETILGAVVAAIFVATMPMPKGQRTIAHRINASVASICLGWMCGGFVWSVFTHYNPAAREIEGGAIVTTGTLGIFLPKTFLLLWEVLPKAIANVFVAFTLDTFARLSKAAPITPATPVDEGEDKK